MGFPLSANYSPRLLTALVRVGLRMEQPLYLVGGTVRDYLLERISNDLDITLAKDPYRCAALLCEELGAGTIVALAEGDEPAVRVVAGGEQVDFSSFRGGAASIEEDLHLRDFTVNAMAADLGSLAIKNELVLVDPTGGRSDLEKGIVRSLPRAFVDDPVRLIRGYRLCAVFGFEMERKTRIDVTRCADGIHLVAVERICHELQAIFESSRTSRTLEMMAEDGLLSLLLPELFAGDGVEQPEFHHLDVLGHSFLALKVMEKIIATPENYYPAHGPLFRGYLADPRVVRGLKWAALMHDVGKPKTRAVREDKDGRVTFYGHDESGKKIFLSYAGRSKWSHVDRVFVAELIGMHMHPFHLCNVQRSEELSPRAALKLSQRAGENLAGLFLLAMADSLASEGEKKPQQMEEELVYLFDVVQKIYIENIEPVVKGPKLITGDDLIVKFGLSPGPLFGRIMSELEMARVDGSVSDKADALQWVKQFLQSEGDEPKPE